MAQSTTTIKEFPRLASEAQVAIKKLETYLEMNTKVGSFGLGDLSGIVKLRSEAFHGCNKRVEEDIFRFQK